MGERADAQTAPEESMLYESMLYISPRGFLTLKLLDSLDSHHLIYFELK